MTSSFRKDENLDNVIYEDVNGSTETMMMGVYAEEGDGTGIAAPPDKLSEFQIKAYTNLIEINPKGWEKQIKSLTDNYSTELGGVNAYTNTDINDFDSEKLDLSVKTFLKS